MRLDHGPQRVLLQVHQLRSYLRLQLSSEWGGGYQPTRHACGAAAGLHAAQSRQPQLQDVPLLMLFPLTGLCLNCGATSGCR